MAKGYRLAAAKAPTLGADGFQYFTSNPRGFRGRKALDHADADAGRAILQAEGLVSIGHAPYLINLASPDEELYRLSIDALILDLEVAEARGSYAVVVHCGKHKGEGIPYAVERTHEALNEVLGRYSGSTRLLLENTAGQGSETGTTLEDWMALASPFPKERVGLCLDTQHGYASGLLPETDVTAFEGFTRPDFMERLGAIHFNDSKVPAGAKKDRHELIAQGAMGPTVLRALLTEARLQDVPFFLETPVEHEETYALEIAACRELIKEAP